MRTVADACFRIIQVSVVGVEAAIARLERGDVAGATELPNRVQDHTMREALRSPELDARLRRFLGSDEEEVMH